MSSSRDSIFPQIAIAIGVLTSNSGEADEPLWRIGRGSRVPLQGAIVVYYGWGRRVTTNFGGVVVVPLQGAIVVCYGWGRRVTTNFGGAVVVPLQGAIVLWFWWSGRGAIAGCQCSVVWLGVRRVTTNFGGVDVVPLLGAHTQQWHPHKLT